MGVGESDYDALTQAYEHPGVIPLSRTMLEVTVAGGETRFVGTGEYAFLNQLVIEPSGTVKDRHIECQPETVRSLRCSNSLRSRVTTVSPC